MPNRILKESVCVSESIDALSFQEEVFFYRLLVNCDDYGRMDGRDSVLKARLFPLREFSAQCTAAVLDRLEELGMVRRYQAEGKPYLQVVNWEAHQKVRSRRGKYPPPGEDAFPAREDHTQTVRVCGQTAEDRAQNVRTCGQTETDRAQNARTCGQTAEDQPQTVRTCGQTETDRAPNPIQSEAESKSESESESEAGTERGLLSAADAARWREETEAIEGQAARMGMAFAPSDRDRAERLMAEYSAPWLMEAMRRAAGGQASCRSWRYIEGILKAWREKGGIDLVHGGSVKGGAKQGHGTAEGPVCPPLRIRRY